MSRVRLIVGLGNPSPDYDATRHNVGALWVRWLAQRYSVPLKGESKLKGELGRGDIEGTDVRLLVPSTYMNNSGEAVAAVARFYKIEPAEILIAYDEMAFAPGIIRLRSGGGDNGHNGIKSVVASLAKCRDFHRLRIGVDHPGDKNRVTAYLTQIKMPAAERDAMERAWDFPTAVLRDMLAGEWGAAMNVLHSDAAEQT